MKKKCLSLLSIVLLAGLFGVAQPKGTTTRRHISAGPSFGNSVGDPFAVFTRESKRKRKRPAILAKALEIAGEIDSTQLVAPQEPVKNPCAEHAALVKKLEELAQARDKAVKDNNLIKAGKLNHDDGTPRVFTPQEDILVLDTTIYALKMVTKDQHKFVEKRMKYSLQEILEKAAIKATNTASSRNQFYGASAIAALIMMCL